MEKQLLEKQRDAFTPCDTIDNQGKASSVAQSSSGGPAGLQGALPLLPGDVVYLHGLVARPELNYKVGIIMHRCQISTRLAVSLKGFPEAAPALVKDVKIALLQDLPSSDSDADR